MLKQTKVVVFVLVAFAFALGGAAQAGDPELKFSKYIKLADLTADYSFMPDMAWSGSVFAVVYSDYCYNISSSGVYLMFVDANGTIKMSAKKISAGAHGLCPKIVWTGSKFGILYATGSTSKLNYFLDCYNTSGNRISQEKLPGETRSTYYGIYSRLVWMGNSFGVFYYGDASGYYNKPLFYKTSGSGAPSEDLVMYDSEPEYLDVYWDGKRFVVLTGTTLYSWIAHNMLQIFTLDANGKLISEKAQIINSPPTTCSGISLLQIKKSKYLILTSGECPGAGVGPPAADRYDLFAAQVKVKTMGISNISLQNTSKSFDSGWRSPTGVSVGNNYYMTASFGCGLAVARINDKGQVIGTPLANVYGA